MKALEHKVPPPARLAFVLYMNRFQIDPEEKVLEELFGEDYLAYKKKVRPFDVESNEALHVLLTERAKMIPATFELYPLIDPKAAQKHLKKDAR